MFVSSSLSVGMSDGIPDCADKDSPQNLRHTTVFVCPKQNDLSGFRGGRILRADRHACAHREGWKEEGFRIRQKETRATRAGTETGAG